MKVDSGAQGHRKYSDMMFSWVGAAIEIPPKVWKLLIATRIQTIFLETKLIKEEVSK